MTKKKRITISLSEDVYERMMTIINEVNETLTFLHLTKSTYIEDLIFGNYIDDWISK